MFRKQISIVLAFLFTQPFATVSLESHKNVMVKKLIQKMNTEEKIPKTWLESQFNQLKLNESVLNLMQKPLEGKPWHAYKTMMVSKNRVRGGQVFVTQNKAVLNMYEKKFQVPASVVSAIIGIETSYGQNKGDFNVLEALSTLAFYYTPRSQFFYEETKSLLSYAYRHNIDINAIKSSYAGAIGIPQFMPSNIEKYGIKHKKTGQVNLYSNTNDAIASVFNYLKTNGQWQPNQPVMKKLNLGKEKKGSLKKMLAETRMLKVNRKLEQYFNLKKDAPSWLIKLQKADGDYDYYRVYHNFRVIMRYNNSIHYSSAVYTLSQRLQPFIAETQKIPHPNSTNRK